MPQISVGDTVMVRQPACHPFEGRVTELDTHPLGIDSYIQVKPLNLLTELPPSWVPERWCFKKLS